MIRFSAKYEIKHLLAPLKFTTRCLYIHLGDIYDHCIKINLPGFTVTRKCWFQTCCPFSLSWFNFIQSWFPRKFHYMVLVIHMDTLSSGYIPLGKKGVHFRWSSLCISSLSTVLLIVWCAYISGIKRKFKWQKIGSTQPTKHSRVSENYYRSMMLSAFVLMSSSILNNRYGVKSPLD